MSYARQLLGSRQIEAVRVSSLPESSAAHAALEFPHMSSKTFADLGVSKAVSAALEKRGFTEPFAIQNLIIGDILDGRDVLAKSPTGSGKTLAFGVPMLDRLDANGYGRPSALVLAPTRELASQIVDELYPLAHARALKITTVYGGVGITKQE